MSIEDLLEKRIRKKGTKLKALYVTGSFVAGLALGILNPMFPPAPDYDPINNLFNVKTTSFPDSKLPKVEPLEYRRNMAAPYFPAVPDSYPEPIYVPKTGLDGSR